MDLKPMMLTLLLASVLSGLSTSVTATDWSNAPLEAVQQAAAQGESYAQYDLGMRHYHGRDLPKNDQQAALWIGKAAQQGDLFAQYNIGWLYEHGRGLQQDPQQALRWYRQAAQQGHTTAQKRLGQLYAEGNTVAQDNSEAYIWLSVALANSTDPSMLELKDALAKRLTPAQLTAAQQQIRDYSQQ